MRRSQTINPVILLDEVDKMVTEFQGDPSSALLEVLDPQQNKQFHDHFLGVPYDLSRVIFIATVNDLDNLSPALEDRLEVIEFEGYMDQEKEMIAQTFLIPRQLKAHGIQDVPIHIEKSALKKIIREYTYEAGVRNLDRRIARSVAQSHPTDRTGGNRHPAHHAPPSGKVVGCARVFTQSRQSTGCHRHCHGLGVDEQRGDAMTIEVLVVPGKGNLLSPDNWAKSCKKAHKPPSATCEAVPTITKYPTKTLRTMMCMCIYQKVRHRRKVLRQGLPSQLE
jgi:ATP-dependent Lon protease